MIDTSIDNQAMREGATPDTVLLSATAQQLLNRVKQYMTPVEVEQVAVALQLAQKTCGGVSEHSEASLQTLQRIPPLEHALAVATILTEMHIDAIGVAAGLIFEAVDAERLSVEQVENLLGTPVARVVGSMLRLNILERTKQVGAQFHAPAANEAEHSRDQKKRRIREALRRQQAETVRKMFVGMAEDPRVVLLKLAYRLHAMRIVSAEPHRRHSASDPLAEQTGEIQAQNASTDQQELHLMAQETREIYAPLAGRLGMSRVESELEDLAFAILEPDKYEWIRNQVEAESKQWKTYVDRVCSILRDEMASIGLKAEVSGRVKHYYSFYKKLQRSAGELEQAEDLASALDLSQIHDLIAFRILVDSTPDCYLALGHVHSLWKPKDGRIKDFIANPKTNGYRALHTTVFCLDEQLVEIQIRTFSMHEMAEYGVAMHWHYKDVGDSASASAKELLSWLRQLADWQRDLRSSATSDTEFADAVKDDIFQEQIFVFTPRGEVKDLPVGSTPLDFAYRIHSKLGDRCAGARIIMENGTGDRLVTRMVPLDYELRSGEIVDIVTNRTAHPTRDWLNFARTAAARSKIRRYLKTHERDINIQIGRERLDRELKIMGVARGVEIVSEDMQKWLEEEYSGKTYEDILAGIGSDEFRPHAVAVKIHERYQQREGKEIKEEEGELQLPTTSKATPSAHLQVAGVNGLLTNLANCCCPLPGDEIVGFISRGKGAIIHRADCRNIERYRERDRERLISVSWVSMGPQRYLAPVLITAHDRAGLIRDIATVVSELNVNMTSVSSTANSNREHVTISATLEIDSLDQLQRVFSKLEKVKSVIHIERDLGKKRRRSA
ncbi:MAG TPA: HD domain-containing protein [Ktedonobacteraceae bacterium]|nr:HD domain-containing protein [Ktedonobacteraceae bacterium]